MKRVFKLLSECIVVMTLAVVLTGCTKDETKYVESDLDNVEKTVQNEFNDSFTYSEDKMQDAMNYIHEHIDDIDDKEIAKKVYEKAAYIENVAKTSETEIDNTITQYASKAKEYAHDVYLADENELEDVIDKGKSTLESFKNSFETDKDKLMTEFSNFFK